MRYLRNSIFIILIVFSVIAFAISGCGHQKLYVQDLLDQSIEEVGHFNSSKKYKKSGITIVYLTGSPYEIGLAHGKLCREEILEINKPIFEFYNGMSEESKHWWSKTENLEKQIPAEYIEEMHGIADGSHIEYNTGSRSITSTADQYDRVSVCIFMGREFQKACRKTEAPLPNGFCPLPTTASFL